MRTATIEDLAYLVKQAKDEGLPKPIVFLGAGASKTGGVPLAKEIIEDILGKYKDNPNIKVLKEEDKTYPLLMSYLTPFERNKLLKEYIDKAKINVTHIYLAQLIINGFVDYVLTVNFDNLMLRALALYNEFPPTYDMAILKDLTTTSFKEKSVVYLHGQHHGLWLLNTIEEMAKVKELIPPILSSIKNQRIWIFIGYSGEDPIFEHITKLGRFDNGLYWVTYNENVPCKLVCKHLLEKDNTNAFLIKGYDSDSFMLKLSTELNLPQPSIIDKPFTSLKNTLDNIVDIDDKEHFKGVKQRLEIVKKDVSIAIQQFEEGKIDSSEKLKQEIDIHLLKKKIIDKIIKGGNYEKEEIQLLEGLTINLNNEEINTLMAELYNTWGAAIFDLAKSKKERALYENSFEKYKKAIELNPNNDAVFFNWGTSLSHLAQMEKDEAIYVQSLEKYKKATELNPKNDEAFSNWGTSLSHLGELKKNVAFYEQSFEKFKNAEKINSKGYNTFFSWGTSLFHLADLKKDEALYKQSFEKFKRATEINPIGDSAYNLWGVSTSHLANLKKNEKLYKEGIEKFEKATELNPKNESAFLNWGTSLSHLAQLKNKEALYKQSFEKFKLATELNPENDSAFHSWGTSLSHLAQLKKDVELYEQSFVKFRKATELNPNNDSTFFDWGTSLLQLAQLKKDVELYEESFEKYEKATSLNSKNVSAFSNWGNALFDLAELKEEKALYEQSILKNKIATELNPNGFQFSNLGTVILKLAQIKNDVELYSQSFENLNKAIELGGGIVYYNLATWYAVQNMKVGALANLELSLRKNEISTTYIENDDDWKLFFDDPDFIKILNKFREIGDRQ